MASRGPVEVSFGAESFFLDRTIEYARTAKKFADRTFVLLNGDGMTDVELVGICETRSMDDALRVIIVDEANKIKGDKALKAYIEEKSIKDDSTILVVIVRSDKCPDVWVQAAKKGKLTEHKKLKTYEENNEVVKWIDSEAREIGLSLDTGLSEEVFKRLGNDLHRISNELRKLQILVGKRKATAKDFDLVVAPSPMADPYQVAEAASNRDRRRAMDLLSTVYKNMGEEANVPLTYALMRQVEKLVVVRSLLDRGMPTDDIPIAIGMNPYRFKKSMLPQAQKHQLKNLFRAMSRLCKLDADVKGSARSKRTHVELAVLSVTG